MDALFLHGARDARIGAFAPVPAGNQSVMLDVAAVGLCGSDLHYYKDGGIGAAVIKAPFVPGHEFGGYLCDDCESLGLAKGTLVAVDPNKACGSCPWCQQGYDNLCPKVEFIGAPPFAGAMTHQISVPLSQIVPVPTSFDPLETAMIEPLGVAIHAVDLAKPKLLERVAVVGCGPIGLLIIQILRVSGVGEILAVDPLAHRRSAARQLGANQVGASVEAIADWTKGEGCSLVIEATNSPFGFRDAVLAARVGGRIVLVGIPDGDSYTLPAAEARRRALSIKFARRMGHVLPRAITLVASRQVDVAAIVSHRIGLGAVPAVFEDLANDAPDYLKVMIYPNGVK